MKIMNYFCEKQTRKFCCPQIHVSTSRLRQQLHRNIIKSLTQSASELTRMTQVQAQDPNE